MVPSIAEGVLNSPSVADTGGPDPLQRLSARRIYPVTGSSHRLAVGVCRSTRCRNVWPAQHLG